MQYDAPSQSYPMQDQSYDPYVNAQQQAYHAESQPLAYPQQGYAPGPGGPEVGGYNYQPEYAHPPPGQGYAQYPPNGPGAMAPYGAPAAGMVAAAATMSQGHESSMGLVDGMMVRVKVGFVRTLEDELGTCQLELSSGPIIRYEQFHRPHSPFCSSSHVQPSPRASNSTCTTNTTTGGPCAKTKIKTGASYPSHASSHGPSNTAKAPTSTRTRGWACRGPTPLRVSPTPVRDGLACIRLSRVGTG